MSELITNGGFSTGTFAGWTAGSNQTNPYQASFGGSGNSQVVNSTSGQPAWFMRNVAGGSATPISGYTAFNGFDGSPGKFTLSQTIHIDETVSSAILKFDFASTTSYSGAARTFDVVLTQGGVTKASFYHFVAPFGDSAWSPVTQVSLDIGATLNSLSAGDYTLTFVEVIPSNFTGPGAFGLDNISLNATFGPSNVAPVAVADAFAATEDGAAVTLNVLANDTDADAGDTKTLVSVNTTGTTGSATANADGTVTYNPGANFQSLKAGATATDTFSYTLKDTAGLTSTTTVTMTVTGVNDGVIAVADSGAATEDGAAVTLDVLTNDTDVDAGDTKTLVSVDATGALGSVSANADGTVSYVTESAFQSLKAGATATDTFSYTVRDSAGAESTASVTMTVTGVNDGPVALADAGSVSEDQSVILNVLANDTDIDTGDLKTLVSVSATTSGASVAIVDGKVVYTADADTQDLLTEGQTATDSFTYVMADSAGATSTATVSVTVGGVANGANILGTVKSDVLLGTAADERIEGGNGDDTVNGYDGADNLFGGNGGDRLFGGAGIDQLSGENGSDTLDGGAGNDILTGGNGPDRFVFGAGFGNDTITDFKAQNDTIQIDHNLVGGFGALMSHASQVGSSVVIALDAAHSITLQGVNLSSLSSSDFVFS
ncbi:Ig-like domain-containing protein [Phenylobacterium sp.]|uniref:Ig-like domain-containing protein n=1 Tax=Phenylobacterium sp. TaxID=1871053 RepID=UPI00271FC21E|nr:Ig-like domain-containing protein [Phenylobacterium sp.]MDO8802619.1 Ig-like domain-containing protein [Phenylobacterium sp.]